MGKPSALFVDRTYVEQQLATLRSDIITVLEAKFRVVQNDQERIIRLLEELDFPQELLVNSAPDRLAAFFRERAIEL